MKNFFLKKEGKKSNASPPGGPNGGLSLEELQNSNNLLLEQLSKVSQDLANARMDKQEAEQSNTILLAKEKDLQKQVTSLEAQVKKISQSFAFEEAQKLNDKARELNEALTAETDKGKALEAKLTTVEDRLATLEKSEAQSTEEKAKLRARIGEQLEELRTKDETISNMRSLNTDQTVEMNELRDTIRKEREGRAKENEMKITDLQNNFDAKLREADERIDRLEGERNSYMQKCKTLQKEVGKLLKKIRGNEAKDLKRQVELLQSELERRSKSLQDALSALDTYVNQNVGTRGAKNIEAANGKHQWNTLQFQLKKLKAQLREAEVKLNEKEMVISQLKNATKFFGEKIIELEDHKKKIEGDSASNSIAQASSYGSPSPQVEGTGSGTDQLP